jgi:hypothetical protein
MKYSNRWGRRIKEQIKLIIRPIDSSTPILAVPACEENARLPKLAPVVSALKKTALAVPV